MPLMTYSKFGKSAVHETTYSPSMIGLAPIAAAISVTTDEGAVNKEVPVSTMTLLPPPAPNTDEPKYIVTLTVMIVLSYRITNQQLIDQIGIPNIIIQSKEPN